MADVYPIEIEQKATFQLRIAIIDETSVPIYSGAWTPSMQIRAAQDAAAALVADASATPNSIVYDPTTGYIDAILAASITQGITVDSAFFDVRMTNGSLSDRILQGPVSINKAVT